MEEILRVNCGFITSNLCNENKVLLHLYENDILAKEEVNRLIENGLTHNRNWEIVNILSKKQITAAKLFPILTITGNSHIVSKLSGKQEAYTEQIVLGRCTPSENFVGRRKEINEITSHFSKPNSKIVNISGPKGIGKSELVTVYANEFLEKTRGNVVFLNSSSGLQFVDSIRRLLHKLNINFDKKDFNPKQISTYVEKISKYFENTPSLFIFEDFDSKNVKLKEVLKSIISLHPFKNRPNVIITTNTRTLSKCRDIEAHCIDIRLEELSQKSCRLFFEKTFKIGQCEDIDNLFNVCQGHPLLMQSIVGYIKSIGTTELNRENLAKSIKMYIERFESSTFRSESKLPGTNLIDENLARSTKILLEKLSSEKYNVGKTAITMLTIASILNSESIRKDVIFNILASLNRKSKFLPFTTPGVPLKRVFENAFKLICDYYLFKTKDHVSHISVNRSLQSIIRGLCLHDLKKHNIIVTTLQFFCNGFCHDMTQMSHVPIVWQNAAKYLQKNKLFALADLLPCVFYIYIKNKKFTEASSYCNTMLHKMTAALGPENQFTLKMNRCKAKILMYNKNVDESVNLLQEIFVTQSKYFGESNVDCLATALDTLCFLLQRDGYSKVNPDILDRMVCTINNVTDQTKKDKKSKTILIDLYCNITEKETSCLDYVYRFINEGKRQTIDLTSNKYDNLMKILILVSKQIIELQKNQNKKRQSVSPITDQIAKRQRKMNPERTYSGLLPKSGQLLSPMERPFVNRNDSNSKRSMPNNQSNKSYININKYYIMPQILAEFPV